MNLTEEQLAEVEAFGAAFMKPEEIAVIMELEPVGLRAAIEDQSSAVAKAYKKGFLSSKFQVNRKIVDLAKAGSSPAQAMANKLIQDIEFDGRL